MDIRFDVSKVQGYSSKSQISRLLTEKWVERNIYCPNCGNDRIVKFENNRPVADFFCDSCREEYELKSKSLSFGHKVSDGAYKMMIERISSNNNPNFLFLKYNTNNLTVENLFIVPKFYFIPRLIEKRKPLSSTARRAGWIGCNILIGQVPQTGRLYLVRDYKEIPKESVIKKWKQGTFLREQSEDSRGWLLDIMNCVDAIQKDEFTLDDVYRFEENLKILHPNNNFIRDKIRQQLQLLRDKGILEFVSRGVYRKI